MVPWMPAWNQRSAWPQPNKAWPAPWNQSRQYQQATWQHMPRVLNPCLKQNQPYYYGGGKGGGHYNPQRKPPPSIPHNFHIDSETRYTGTVSFYHKWKGYGFIEVAQTGVVPQDRLFVHWRNIQSDDRYPFLVKGLEVEFGLLKWQDKFQHNLTTIRAKLVTLVGGTNIAMQDDVDAQEKEFVGGQHLRYTGTLKFFNPRCGFGYVTMDAGYDVDTDVPGDLRVETTEVNAGGRRPLPMKDLSVEFGVWKTSRGRYKVYNMTLPGGHPLTQDALENRITMGVQSYTGHIAIWNWRQGWGFIRADPSTVLPPRALSKMHQQQQAAQARGKRVSLDDKMFYFRRADLLEGWNPTRDSQVSFQIYIDDKGVGAYQVMEF